MDVLRGRYRPRFGNGIFPWMSTFAALIILVTVASFLPGKVAPGPDTGIGTNAIDGPSATNIDPTQAVLNERALPPEAKTDTEVAKASVAGDGDASATSTGVETPRQNGNNGSPSSVAARSTNQETRPQTADHQQLPASFVIGPEGSEPFRLGPDDGDEFANALLPPLPTEEADPVALPTPDKIGSETRTPSVPTDAEDVTADRPFTLLGVDGAKHRYYRSLEPACADAADGGKIELRYNGIRREQTPIRIEGKRITIRAAIGYHPTLELAPAKIPFADYRNHFITVAGGALEMANINLLLSINDQFPSDRWSIFSLEQPESVQMEGVTVTVHNRDRRRQIAVFELTPAPILSDMPMPEIG